MKKMLILGLLVGGLSVLFGCESFSSSSCWWKGEAFKQVQDSDGKIYSVSKYEEFFFGQPTEEVYCKLTIGPEQEQVRELIVRGLSLDGEGYVGSFRAERLESPGHKPEALPYKLVDVSGGLFPDAPIWK